MKFKINDFVLVKSLRAVSSDCRGRITYALPGRKGECEYHVSSMNMPFCGVICDWFKEEDLEYYGSRKRLDPRTAILPAEQGLR